MFGNIRTYFTADAFLSPKRHGQESSIVPPSSFGSDFSSMQVPDDECNDKRIPEQELQPGNLVKIVPSAAYELSLIHI